MAFAMSRQIYVHEGTTKASRHPVVMFLATHPQYSNTAGFATLARYLLSFYSKFITNITTHSKHNVGRPCPAP